ncbi:MAG: EutN/CcmL family microcompartment protein [bacterium]|nr:EutN/CcmL family microcompartment protein [bacterium]
MDIGKIIGVIVATQKDPSLAGTKICIVQPLDENRNPVGKPIIATDHTASVGMDETVYYVTGGDAAVAHPDRDMPVDIAIVGIVDFIDVSAPIEKSG